MKELLKPLLVVQDRDQRIARCQRELQDIPARRSEIELQLEEARQAIQDAAGELKRQTAHTRELEVEIESRKQHINKLRAQQMSCKTNQEYRAIEREVATIEKQILGLEDEEIQSMETMENLKVTIAGRQEVLQRDAEHIEDELEALGERLERMGRELTRLQEERARLATEVDAAILRRYERAMAHWGDAVIVPVQNKTCGGCHMALPPQATHDARKRPFEVTCSFCGRFLYVPE